ncbi:MAG: hypothetical protein ACLRMN_08540 [Mediterraneibacter gnavus]
MLMVIRLIVCSYGIVWSSGFLVCFLGTREHIQINRSVNAEKEGIKDYIKVVFTNSFLGAIILLTIFTIFGNEL